MGITGLAIKGQAMDKDLKGLTDRQRVFVMEYTADADLNQTKAARRAGYKKPSGAGIRLMANSKIQRAIRNRLRPRLERLELTTERVLEELAYQVFRDPIDMTDENGVISIDDIRKLPPSIRKTINGIKAKQRVDRNTGDIEQTVELKLTDKMKALELAMKYLGLLHEKMEEGVGGKTAVDWENLYNPSPNVSGVIEGKIVEAQENE